MVSGEALDSEDLEEDEQNLFRYRDDGTTAVHKWITDVLYDVFKRHGESVQRRWKRR